MPTARRGPSATLVRRGGERLLIDCGEGTQRQLLRSDLGLVDLQEIFLTHFHADHFLGLPGMLKTFALRGRELPLTVYGPRGLDELFQSLRRIFGRLTFEVAVVELAADAVLPRDGYSLRTFPARHGRDAIGYALVEDARPGRFDVETADALGIPVRTGARRPAERGGRDARGRPHRDAGTGARGGTSRTEGRVHGRHGAVRPRRRGGVRRRPARPRGDVLRGRGRARRRDRRTRPRSKRRAWPRTRTSGCSR